MLAVLHLRHLAQAVDAGVAGLVHDAAHDSVALFEAELLFCDVAGCGDGAGALVRARAGKFGAEGARLHHAVCVAVRGHCDFDEEVMGTEFGGDVDGVDFVGFVVFHHLDGFHLGREAHFRGCECCFDGKEDLVRSQVRSWSNVWV